MALADAPSAADIAGYAAKDEAPKSDAATAADKPAASTTLTLPTDAAPAQAQPSGPATPAAPRAGQLPPIGLPTGGGALTADTAAELTSARFAGGSEAEVNFVLPISHDRLSDMLGATIAGMPGIEKGKAIFCAFRAGL